MDDFTDFDAVVRAGSIGNTSAIEYLWSHHQPALLGWLLSMEPAIAEDVASETWIDAINGLAKFSGNESQFRSWIFTIARRRLIDRQRRLKHKPDRFGLGRLNAATSTDASFDAIRNAETQQAISHILLSLPKDQAEAVLLGVLGGL